MSGTAPEERHVCSPRSPTDSQAPLGAAGLSIPDHVAPDGARIIFWCLILQTCRPCRAFAFTPRFSLKREKLRNEPKLKKSQMIANQREMLKGRLASF